MKTVMYAPGELTRGIGHSLRSLALAEEAIGQGWEVCLAGRLEGPALSRARRVVGLELAGDTDRSALVQLASTADVLHLDTYDEWLGSVPPGSALLSCMVDAEFGRRRCDLAIDTSPSAPLRLDRLQDVAPHVLLGPDFAPLAASVRAVGGAWSGGAGGRPSVLVVMGGTDPFGLVVPVVEALSALDPSPDVTVVRSAAQAGEVARAWGAAAGSLHGVEFLDDLIATACRHDVIISASGTTVWELAHAGVPAALVCAADNQVDYQRAMVSAGAAVSLGADPDKLRDRIGVVAALLADRSRRDRLSASGRTLVDGHGAWRVVETWRALLRSGGDEHGHPGDPSVTVRLADRGDADRLLAWRRDPVTRSFSRHSGDISASDHAAWLENTLASPDRHLLVVERDGAAVGTARWDRVPGPSYEQRWEISVSIAPEHRGRGLAGPMVHAAEKWLRGQEPGPLRLVATMHEDNTASTRLFERAGYLPFGRVGADGFGVLSRSR